jgi:hypothetical protein
VLLNEATLRGIEAGEITLAFRVWRRPSVRAGGTLRTRVGVLAIEAVDVVDPADVTDDDARRAGHPDREALLAALRGSGALHRVAFRLAGPDPRIALRSRASLDGAERAELDARLARLDTAGRKGPWTRSVLQLIAERPATRAADLAAELGRDRMPLKLDIRKLKELGLTESLEVGYGLSPRGEAYLRES